MANKKRQKPATKSATAAPSRAAPRIVERIDSDEDDEEINEDEAFNSEDELKYGAFFDDTNNQRKTRHGDDDNDESDSDDSDGSSHSEEEDDIQSTDNSDHDQDDDEGDGGQYMLDLLNQLDSTHSSTSKNATTAASKALASNVPESEFAASVVKNTHMTLDTLLHGLQDTQGFGVLQKTLAQVTEGQTTSVPLAKVVSDRVQRKLHYQHQSEEIAQWMEAVQQNRQAETLDFRHKERLGDLTKEELVEKFMPTTDFEKELHQALQEAGQQDEEAILQKEEQQIMDDLGSNKLSMEEYKRRRAQLAKMRAFMFYHEQKRHHINKIKSKKYRRIRKKQRERLKEADMAAQIEEDPDLVKELEEKEEVERMKERMTLAHKNTSKWAKRVLKRGKNMDVDTRRALSAQLKRGDDLRKKMNATGDDGDSDDDDKDGNDDLVELARKVLADTEDESNNPVQGKGLFKLSFMQRGIQAQRDRAKEEARQLLRELEANEQQDDDNDDNMKEANEVRPSKKRVASVEEMKKVLDEGQLVAKSLEFGNSNSIAVSSGIDIDLSLPGGRTETTAATDKSRLVPASSQHSTTFAVSDHSDQAVAGGGSTSDVAVLSQSSTRLSSSTALSSTEGAESNPWMLPAEETKKENPKSNRLKKKRGAEKANVMIDIDGAIVALDGKESDKKPKVRITESPEIPAVAAKEAHNTIASLSQEELVRRAFARPDDKEAEEEFLNEKRAMETRDDPTRNTKEESKTVSGWGSWTGEGATAQKPPRMLPKHLQAPEKKLPKRKRQDEKKPNVIINEKRLKKTANQFQIAQIPYPFTSREEYERAMTGGVGKEWNVTSAVKNMTRPAIMTRAGKMIQPISKKVKQQRPAAKF